MAPYGPPIGFGGPPNDNNKEPLPKSIGEVPKYLSHILGGFFSRLSYIFRLIWGAKKSLLIMMEIKKFSITL